MRLIEIFEATPAKKTIPPFVPRNLVAKYAQKSGSGPHTDKKYSRKEKYKKPIDVSENK